MAEALQALASRLAIPGLPDWIGLVVLLVLGLAMLAFLAMPFSVFGVKARLEQIEAQLDEIQTEMRSLVFPAARRRTAVSRPSHSCAAPLRADWSADR